MKAWIVQDKRGNPWGGKYSKESAIRMHRKVDAERLAVELEQRSTADTVQAVSFVIAAEFSRDTAWVISRNVAREFKGDRYFAGRSDVERPTDAIRFCHEEDAQNAMEILGLNATPGKYEVVRKSVLSHG